MIEIEQELRSQLTRRAGSAPVADGWAGVHRRIERRERARRARRTALTVVAVVVLSAGAVTLVGGRDGTPVATAPATAALPHLIFDVPGYEVSRAAETDPSSTGGPPVGGPVTGSVRLSVLWEPDRGYDGRLLFVHEVAAGAPFGFGEQDPTAERVPVGAATGYLRTVTGAPTKVLGWQNPGGDGVYVIAVRFTRDELVRTYAGGVLTTPPGLELQRTTVVSYGERAQAEVASAGQEDRLVLRLQAGGPEVLDNLVADRVASALEVSAVMVGGIAAVYTGEDTGRGGLGSTSLIWPVRDGVVAELVADGAARSHLTEAAESLRTVPDAEWRSMVARTASTTVPPTPGLNAVRSAMAEACSARTAWLEARQRSDGIAQARLAIGVSELFRRGSEEGWGKDSDILVVIKSLADAMKAGDVAVVQATPGGGCP